MVQPNFTANIPQKDGFRRFKGANRVQSAQCLAKLRNDRCGRHLAQTLEITVILKSKTYFILSSIETLKYLKHSPLNVRWGYFGNHFPERCTLKTSCSDCIKLKYSCISVHVSMLHFCRLEDSKQTWRTFGNIAAGNINREQTTASPQWPPALQS